MQDTSRMCTCWLCCNLHQLGVGGPQASAETLCLVTVEHADDLWMGYSVVRYGEELCYTSSRNYPDPPLTWLCCCSLQMWWTMRQCRCI